MDPNAIKQKMQQHIAAAKGLAAPYAGREGEMPESIQTQIASELGKSDELKAQLLLAEQMKAADAFMAEPAVTPAVWRQAGPDEGNAPVDSKAWRSITIPTVFGEKEVRFHVPLTVQHKDYAPAFEAYLRKGYGDMGPNDRKTLSEGVDSAGGFTVPEDYQTELIKKQATMAHIRALARVISTGRDMVSFPRVNYTTDNKYTSGVRMTWTGEAPASSTTARVTDPVFGKINIPVHTAMATMPISNDLIEDSVFDIAGYSSDLLGEAFALGENDTFLNGTGVNQPMGILTEAGGNGPAQIATGTSASLSTSGDAHAGKRLLDLYYAVPAQYRYRSVFLLSSVTMEGVDNLVDAQKRPLINSLTQASIAMGEPSTIKGRPVIVDEFVPDLGASANCVIFGDWSGYIIVDRVAFAVQRLTELYAETNLTLLLARKRVGGYCTEPYRLRILNAA